MSAHITGVFFARTPLLACFLGSLSAQTRSGPCVTQQGKNWCCTDRQWGVQSAQLLVTAGRSVVGRKSFLNSSRKQAEVLMFMPKRSMVWRLGFSALMFL